MNSVGYCVTLGPQLREDEAQVVENAIRLAVDSIVNVLFGVNSSRAREYHQVLSERDKEIQRLENRLRETEEDLEVIRQLGCGCGGNGTHRSLERSPSSGDLGAEEQSGAEAVCEEPEEEETQAQHCEMTLTLGLYGEPPAHVSPPSMESTLHPSHSHRLEKEHSSSAHVFTPSGMSCVRGVPPSVGSAPLMVKEEPHDISSALIKWEMSENGGRAPSASVENIEDEDGTHFGEIPHVDVQALRMNTNEQIRRRKRPLRTSEPTNEALSLKRAAWRAASRRYYARKVARQRLRPSQPPSFLHMGFSSPTLHDAQRAASRGYYGRKGALNQPGDPQGANIDNSHSEGILCS